MFVSHAESGDQLFPRVLVLKDSIKHSEVSLVKQGPPDPSRFHPTGLQAHILQDLLIRELLITYSPLGAEVRGEVFR